MVSFLAYKHQTKRYKDIKKYFDIDKFWALLERKYGYKSAKKSLKNFMICLLITHFYNDYHGTFPPALNKFLLDVQNNAYVLVNNWINHKKDGDLPQDVLGLPGRLFRRE